MEDLLSKLDKIKKIEDPKIRQALESDVPERAAFGSGGVASFLGTTDLPPEAYGTEYKNLPDPFRKAIEEVADMDLKKLRTVKGQNTFMKALAKQGVPPKEAASFLKSAREAAEAWLGKDSKEFMKTVAKADAPSKIGHIGDLLKANKKGVLKVDTLWKFIKGGLKGMGKAKMVGAGALGGMLISKLLEHGIEEEPPIREEVAKPQMVEEEISVDQPESLDDLKKLIEAM